MALVPLFSWGHGFDTEQIQTVGDYTVEFAYDTPEIYSGEAVSFTFRLLDAASQGGTPFDYLFVRFTKSGGSVMFVSSLDESKLVSGSTRLVVTFPEEGMYNAILSFEGTKGTLVETSFSFPVAPPFEPAYKDKGTIDLRNLLWVIIFGGGALMGFIGSTVFYSRRKKEM